MLSTSEDTIQDFRNPDFTKRNTHLSESETSSSLSADVNKRHDVLQKMKFAIDEKKETERKKRIGYLISMVRIEDYNCNNLLDKLIRKSRQSS